MISTPMEKLAASNANSATDTLHTSALQAAAPIVCALAECDEALRVDALELFKQLVSDDLDHEQRLATTALLAEILFPNCDLNGLPGLDLVEAEAMAPSVAPEAKEILDRMDQEEAFFAQRLRDLMTERGWTQVDLADKVGLGQPAISMMLNRTCRPQRKTVLRFAQAFGVPPADLWPHFQQ